MKEFNPFKFFRGDASTGAMATMMWEHHEIHEGDSWKAFAIDEDFDKSDSLIIAFHTPDTDRHLHIVVGYSCTTTAIFTMLESPTVTNGTGINRIPTYRNRNINNQSGIDDCMATPIANRYRVNPTIAGGGILYQDVTGTNQTGRGMVNGDRGTQEWVLARNTIYAFRIAGTGAGADNGVGEICMTWYEHTPEVM